MKKKILFIFIFVLSIFLLVGCGNPHKDEPQYQIYELAQESGYTGTYEEWLETIKGVKGEDGRPIELTIKDKNIVWRYVGDTNWILLTSIDDLIGPQGPEGKPGETGPAGVSIKKIEKTKTEGLVDTYTIYYSDNTTTFFTVTNGQTGEAGKQGIQGVPGKDGHTPVITISNKLTWVIDGVDTNITVQGPKGDTGETGPEGKPGETGPAGQDGVSITKIEKTKVDGLVDTYTIYFSNNTTSLFFVTNGKPGEQGIQGIPGKDGHTPVITISENLTWVIDGVDTNITVQGPKGDTGETGPAGQDGVSITKIEKTKTEGLIDTYTIYYSNDTTSTFVVTNGQTGETGKPGEQGIQGIPGKDGHTPVITISNKLTWVIDGVDTNITVQGPKGDTGETGPAGQDGVSITKIEKTKTEGLIDTYTIYYSNDTTSTFVVTNGQTGETGKPGEQGIQGIPGKDGHTPVITISENLTWVIDGVDSKITAKGVDGLNGKSAYEIYLEKHPEYTKTEDEWLDDLVNGRLGTEEVKTYTVKFDTGYEFKIPDQVHKQLERIDKPADPVRPGYIFDGWYINDEKVMFTHYFIVEDVTLTAKWTLDEWTINTNVDLDKILFIGDVIDYQFKVLPEGVSQELIYDSNNVDIATIENGVLTVKKAGCTYINVRSKANPNCFIDFYIEVLDPNNMPYEIHCDQLNNFITNRTYNLTIKTNEYVYVDKWSVNGDLAVIDQSGVLTTKKVGTITVNALLNNGVTLTKEYIIESNGAVDLNGYNITIAQSENAIASMDPFNPNYNQFDKEEKQKAWREVESDFNCKITVKPYPADANWGNNRWNYIVNQAKAGVSDYDFLVVPDQKIPYFVQNKALLPVTDYYAKYGNNKTDPAFIQSSTYKNNLYGMTFAKNNINNVMYYNIPLFEQLKLQDPTLVEPAELFNQGKWTYDAFVKYCKQVQDAMTAKYGEIGTANAPTQEYFAVSGWDTYWFIGLSSTDGNPIANTSTLEINMNSPHREEAANVVKELYNKGYASKTQAVDQNVQEWNSGKAFFNTGDLWFVGKNNRWPADLWGEDTRYGYVPWPMPNDMTLDNYKVALGGSAQWVMPVGRDYSNYGPNCTPENIYHAVVEMLQRSRKYYVESAPYDKEMEALSLASRYAQSEKSQSAFIKILIEIERGHCYYEPLVLSDNPVISTYSGDLKNAITGYCVNNTYSTWTDATTNLVVTMKDNLVKAFG